MVAETHLQIGMMWLFKVYAHHSWSLLTLFNTECIIFQLTHANKCMLIVAGSEMLGKRPSGSVGRLGTVPVTSLVDVAPSFNSFTLVCWFFDAIPNCNCNLGRFYCWLTIDLIGHKHNTWKSKSELRVCCGVEPEKHMSALCAFLMRARSHACENACQCERAFNAAGIEAHDDDRERAHVASYDNDDDDDCYYSFSSVAAATAAATAATKATPALDVVEKQKHESDLMVSDGWLSMRQTRLLSTNQHCIRTNTIDHWHRKRTQTKQSINICPNNGPLREAI